MTPPPDAARVPARRGIGRRGAVLLILAAVDFSIGWSYIDPVPETLNQQGVIWREHFAPVWVWGWLWVGVGLVCLLAAVTRRPAAGFTAAVALKLLWGSMELTGWVAHQIHQGYRPTVVWLLVAALIFAIAGLREPCRRPAQEGAR